MMIILIKQSGMRHLWKGLVSWTRSVDHRPIRHMDIEENCWREQCQILHDQTYVNPWTNSCIRTWWNVPLIKPLESSKLPLYKNLAPYLLSFKRCLKSSDQFSMIHLKLLGPSHNYFDSVKVYLLYLLLSYTMAGNCSDQVCFTEFLDVGVFHCLTAIEFTGILFCWIM